MNAPVTFTLVTLLALPVVSCAQDRTPSQDHPSAQSHKMDGGQDIHGAQQPRSDSDAQGKADKTPRRLESVTWNSVKHELTWVIAKGEKQGTSFKPTASDSYAISMDNATMTFNGETRRFSKEEAANVHMLMDVISKYAVDSTVWWDDGQGEPVNGPPKREDKKDEKENTAVLHVSLRTPADVSPAVVQARIEQLKRQLDELQQIKLLLDATSPVQFKSF